MGIHVSGSIAYDRIMTFPGRFEDHLLPDKLHILNVCFLLDGIEERRGGTAGNIAYNLALLEEKPFLYATAGKDFHGYDAVLEALGLPLDGVLRLDKTHTACAYITTDRQGNQITGFSPSAMNTSCGTDRYPVPRPGDWAVVSPGNLEDMRALPALYRATGTPYIFDPGQQTPAIGPEALVEAFTGAAALIGNDYEIEMIRTMTCLSTEDILNRVGFLITTLGAKGSEICRKNWPSPRYVPAAGCGTVLDPTGAGDAYRAGLVKGLHSGLDVEKAAALGSVCASFCIEAFGTQEHALPMDEFRRRYEAAYGAMPRLPSHRSDDEDAYPEAR